MQNECDWWITCVEKTLDYLHNDQLVSAHNHLNYVHDDMLDGINSTMCQLLPYKEQNTMSAYAAALALVRNAILYNSGGCMHPKSINNTLCQACHNVLFAISPGNLQTMMNDFVKNTNEHSESLLIGTGKPQ